jgi:hypothetical protein
MPEATVERRPDGKFARRDAPVLVEEMTDEQFSDMVEMGDRDAGEQFPHVREKGVSTGGLGSETETIAAPKQVLYTPRGARRLISRQDLRELLRGGWKRTCPNCGEKCRGSEEINGCPALPRVDFTACPVCNKKIPDVLEGSEDQASASDDPNFVAITGKTTSRERLQAKLATHMLAFHPQSAALYGFTQRDALPGFSPGGN